MDYIPEVVRSDIRYTQAQHQEQTDKGRIPAPSYQPGDMVWLDGRNIHTARTSKKLETKFHGLFKVIKLIGTHAFELDLPNTMKNRCHFPVSLLRPTANDPLPGQVQPPLPPVVVERDEEWQVERILDSRRRHCKVQ